MSRVSPTSKKPFEFTNINNEKILKLEEEIVYLFGASEPKRVAQHYMLAIKAMEENCRTSNESQLREKMVPFLKDAYEEVKRQTNLKFNTSMAASYEFDLIRAQSKRASFEDIYQIMVNLYEEIFQTNAAGVQKAALLRTFIYLYKIRLLSMDSPLGDEDIRLLKAIAKRSEEELSQLSILTRNL